MGQISTAAVAGVLGLLASVAVPIIWVGDIKQTNAVQDNQIQTLSENYSQMRDDNRVLGQKIDALLIRNGIDPVKFK